MVPLVLSSQVDAEHVKRQIEMISHIITAKEDRPDEVRGVCLAPQHAPRD